MAAELLYKHYRNLISKNEWKPFVKKYFKNPKILHFECGYYYPTLQVDNWDEVKDILPKSYQPIEVKLTTL